MKKLSDAKAAKYALVGFELAYKEVRAHSHTGNRISELFNRLEIMKAALENMSMEKRCRKS